MGKHVWNLSKRKILKLRKEIVLNSMYMEDYENSLKLDPEEVYYYFDGYFDFLYENTPKRGSDAERLLAAFDSDSKENLLAYHATYDRP